jgi:hypothetical protein
MTMEDENSILPPPKHTPWNKGKLIGAKPPHTLFDYLVGMREQHGRR